jgi:phenylacetate-CoA ligase
MTAEEKSLMLAALKRAYNRSSFWRNKFYLHHIKEQDLNSKFDFDRLPFVTKQEILEDQLSNPPYGSLLAVSPLEICRVHKTSGTSANPFLIFLTKKDLDDTYTAITRAFKYAGMKSGDKVIHCLNFNMWSGGITDYLGIEKVGATGIPFGVGNTDLLLQMIKNLKVNAISCTPSYLLTIINRCRDEFNIDPRSLGLKTGFLGGEGLLQVPGIRRQIEESFAMKAIDANYGLSEICSVIGGEDISQNGMSNHSYGILLAEIYCKEKGIIGFKKGCTGELILSTLRKEGQPLFRYKTNDIIEVLDSQMGEDGLLRSKFKVIGRSDEMIVVRGVNFFPQSLHSITSQIPFTITNNYRILRPAPGNIDTLLIYFETSETNQKTLLKFEEEICAKVKSLLQIRIKLHWVKKGCFADNTNKTKYFINTPPI